MEHSSAKSNWSQPKYPPTPEHHSQQGLELRDQCMRSYDPPRMASFSITVVVLIGRVVWRLTCERSERQNIGSTGRSNIIEVLNCRKDSQKRTNRGPLLYELSIAEGLFGSEPSSWKHAGSCTLCYANGRSSHERPQFVCRGISQFIGRLVSPRSINLKLSLSGHEKPPLLRDLAVLHRLVYGSG